ncbi:cation/acetate symporter [Pseudonocardia ammonioxydans]|uniref:Cation/acetate symporter n=1 Tax=Pseudonocardia ammonioxydans TaxID=260086 RepID=A0A1I5HJU8_PSUAM|nr:cation/acetate symporter ActP [Pseudonocardia ammonioxydans]SFO48574.1 cation/acetate symporter [Pseudonocardia ammonioxydans]
MNATRLIAFALIVGLTLVVTVWASRRTHSATDFFAAGRGISGPRNGLAIAGDLMSAATFLGFTGLMYLSGFDGWIMPAVTLVAFVLILLLFAERMRNAGRFTVADVLSFRLRERPVRAATAASTVLVAVIYLVAQLVGAGVLIRALTGLSFTPAVVLTGLAMLAYVVFGGMLATTWVQIIKAVLLLAAGAALTVGVLVQVGFDLGTLFTTAAANSPAGDAYLAPGGSGRSFLDTVSVALAFAIGTAALPHILIRFFTVPDAKQARSSAGWATALIGAFFVMTAVIGFGARAVLPAEAADAVGTSGNLAAPLLAEHLGGGPGTVGGDLFVAFVSAVAFATILAVVAGLVLSASGAVAHDLWANVIHRGRTSTSETRVARIAAAGIGLVAIVITLGMGPEFNVAFLVGLALSVAAGANFPALLLALTWRRFTTTGAIAGIVAGLVTSVVCILLGPSVWPGGAESAPYPIEYPTLLAIPIGFLACWIGTVLSAERGAERSFDELQVRSQTGIGSEQTPVSH